MNTPFHPDYYNRGADHTKNKAGSSAFLFLILAALGVILAASSCTSARYAVKGKDGVEYLAYAGDDVYGDTIIGGKKYVVVYKNPTPPAPQYGYQQPGIPMGQTVLQGYATITHDTPFYGMHSCSLMRPIGKTATGEIVWRTTCGNNYPNESYSPF